MFTQINAFEGHRIHHPLDRQGWDIASQNGHRCLSGLEVAARRICGRKYAVGPWQSGAFKTAALMGFRDGYEAAKPVILEPIMKVEVEAPVEFQGAVVGQVNQRRGVVMDTTSADGTFTVVAEVPLNNMFGYSTDLRSGTQGKGNFTMEFSKYAPLPRNEQEEMIKKHKEKLAAEAKK